MTQRVEEAAFAVIHSRELAQRPHRSVKHSKKPLSIRVAATAYGVAPATLARAVKRLTSQETLAAPVGRPPIFNSDEDDAIVVYIMWMEQGGFPATRQQIEAAAMTLRRRRDPEAPMLSRSWYRRWIEAHPQVRRSTVKAVERDRKSFEMTDIENLRKFFTRFRNLVERHKVGPSDIWNEDECGVRIGSIRERITVVVVRTTRHRRPEVIDPGNRESCTLIGAVNAVGDAMPPWVVFKVFPSESWAETEGSGDIRFARSDTGFSNAEITLDWVHHFNIVSWQRSARAQRTGKTLEQWFGCTAWCTNPNNLTASYCMFAGCGYVVTA
ncbi:hypothetical protein HIM_10872 [Hirsutella minnesotensis 3608]|uniref:HTH CENPB-type domain-containing protein n=1 Tax=Hirsutella minnesotensis 3608 TaxID=1043627 RepID=A0A0F7ZWX5_9HYPO|nr:hypothetical protein HIM_10872 [Hirsutella minnesotensis 3608]